MSAQPALLARHCAEAGQAEKAVAYWLQAGQQALGRSAMTEAVTQLRKGLDVLAGLPDGPSRQEQELDLQTALGWALTATKGYSVSEVEETLARARTLAQQLDRPEHLVPLIFGQFWFHNGRSEHRLALPLAGQLEQISRDLYGLVFQCGGTISGEHGTGLSRSAFVREQIIRIDVLVHSHLL